MTRMLFNLNSIRLMLFFGFIFYFSVSAGGKDTPVVIVSDDCNLAVPGTLVGTSIHELDEASEELFSMKSGAVLVGSGASNMLKGVGHFCIGTVKFGVGTIIVITLVGKFVIIKTFHAASYVCEHIYHAYLDRQEAKRMDKSSSAGSN